MRDDFFVFEHFFELLGESQLVCEHLRAEVQVLRSLLLVQLARLLTDRLLLAERTLMPFVQPFQI